MKNNEYKIPPPTEKEIQNFTLSLFNSRGYYLWRNNTGMVHIGEGRNARMFHAGLKGSADIIGVSPKGLFVALEIKRKGKKPSPFQVNFLKEVKDKGGIAEVIDSIEGAEQLLIDLNVEVIATP